MATELGTFEALTPELVIDSIETAVDDQLMGMATPLTSYINRVYELMAADGSYYIAKFYRPGRWTVDALHDEHDFVEDCVEAEIPVIAPLELANGDTLAKAEHFNFAVFPKRWGRDLEILDDEDWRRLGRVMGRLHLCGARFDAPHRRQLSPSISTTGDLDYLLKSGCVTPNYRDRFADLGERFLDLIIPKFDDCEMLRIHGDLHRANILHRPDEGLMLIDFDDMMVGPPVQDLWMLLPGMANESRREIGLILQGYEDFRPFDDRSLRLIEPLRAMRIFYFLAWCGKQRQDPGFSKQFPDWGSDRFWEEQIQDLERQYTVITTGEMM
jgi:Ser/Thr protein kinase RdoA (MazF antagonist)